MHKSAISRLVAGAVAFSLYLTAATLAYLAIVEIAKTAFYRGFATQAAPTN